MDHNDIRSHHSIERVNSQIARHILRCRPPSSRDVAECSGLNCLIVVLRSIYQHVIFICSEANNFAWFEKSMRENPILRLAWHLFSDEPEEIEQATLSMKQVFEELPANNLFHDDSFERLCSSSLMNDTFWSKKVLRFTNIGYRAVEFDRVKNPGQLLQDIINKSAERCIFSVAGAIRIIYTPNVEHPLEIRDLQSFRIPVTDPCVARVWLAERFEYVLLAVVRLRDKEHPNDYVRTYTIRGVNIIAEYEPPSFMNHHWSVKDAPRKFMLFYGPLINTLPPSTDHRNYPEVEPYPIHQCERDIEVAGAETRESNESGPSMGTSSETKADPTHSKIRYKDPRILPNGDYIKKRAWRVTKDSPGYGSDRPFRQ